MSDTGPLDPRKAPFRAMSQLGVGPRGQSDARNEERILFVAAPRATDGFVGGRSSPTDGAASFDELRGERVDGRAMVDVARVGIVEQLDAPARHESGAPTRDRRSRPPRPNPCARRNRPHLVARPEPPDERSYV